MKNIILLTFLYLVFALFISMLVAIDSHAFLAAQIATNGSIYDHGSLIGLGDDDHPQYLLVTDFTTSLTDYNNSVKIYIDTQDVMVLAQVNLSIDDKITKANNSIRRYADDTFVNQTGDTMTGNLSNTQWFNGLFNWSIGLTSRLYLYFNGANLDFNQTTNNLTIDNKIRLANDSTIIRKDNTSWITANQGYNTSKQMYDSAWNGTNPYNASSMAWVNATYYDRGTSDGRYVNENGDTMTGTLAMTNRTFIHPNGSIIFTPSSNLSTWDDVEDAWSYVVQSWQNIADTHDESWTTWGRNTQLGIGHGYYFENMSIPLGTIGANFTFSLYDFYGNEDLNVNDRAFFMNSSNQWEAFEISGWVNIDKNPFTVAIPSSGLTTSVLQIMMDSYFESLVISDLIYELGYTWIYNNTPRSNIAVQDIDAENLTLSQSLIVGNNTLHVDESTGKVGIGTATPLAKLHLEGANWDAQSLRFLNTAGIAGTNYFAIGQRKTTDADYYFSIENPSGNAFAIDENRYVGIGTTSPSGLLDVNGSVGSIEFDNTGVRQIFTRATTSYIDANTVGGQLSFVVNGDADDNATLFLASGRNIGIGTIAPSSKLHVLGTANITSSGKSFTVSSSGDVEVGI